MGEENIDPERRLIEDACAYVLSKEYPPNSDKNQKRSIRRKAEKLVVKDGEIFYKKQDKEVGYRVPILSTKFNVVAIVVCL